MNVNHVIKRFQDYSISQRINFSKLYNKNHSFRIQNLKLERYVRKIRKFKNPRKVEERI